MTFVPSAADADASRAMTIVSSMLRRWIVCAPLLVVAACSGGDESASTTAPAATVASAPPTTAPPATDPPATTAAPTTEAPATTAAPTTEPPATTAPPVETTPPDTASTDTTTTLSVDEDVDLRVAAVEQPRIARAAAMRVFEDPYNDQLLDELADYYTGSLLEGLTNVVQQLRDGNYRAVQREGQPEVYEPDPRSSAINVDSGRATVQVCHIQTALTVETGGNPDGTDRVVLDEIVEEIVELDLELIDGVWKVSSARAPETEIASCP